jgi:hypothetical protein
MLELFSGLMIRGYTQDLSIDGVFMDSQSLTLEGRDPPRPGEAGVFSLFYQRGHSQDKLRMKCQLVHVVGNGVGLNLNYAGLTQQEQRIVAQIMDNGTRIS